MRNVPGFWKGLLYLLPTLLLLAGTAVPASAIVFSGFVTNSVGTPVSGATVEMVGNAGISTTTGGNGGFTLTGLPFGTTFTLKVTMTGYQPVYTNTLNSTVDITDPAPVILFTAAEVAGWGVASGNGALAAKVMDLTNGTMVSGAVVTASSALHPSTPYDVTYFNGTGFGGSATYANGMVFVLNVDDGDTVTLHTTRTGWSFVNETTPTHAGSVSEALILGASGISFSGLVTNSVGAPISGAKVEIVENSAIYTFTDGNGAFVLLGLPSGSNFTLKVSQTGYLPVYTNTINYTFDIIDPNPKVLFTQAEVAGWGVASGKGVIAAKAIDLTTGSTVSGAVVTASSAIHSSTPYPVTYFNGSSFGGSSTYSNGLVFVMNVDDGDMVTLHTTKNGWNFLDAVFSVRGNTVSEALLLGSFGQKTLSIAVPGTGTGSGTVTGTGQRNGVPVDISCSLNYSAPFDTSTLVTLHAAPVEYSAFTGWSGPCSINLSGDCAVTMDTDKSVTATFDYDTAHKAHIAGTSNYFSTLHDAYIDASATGNTNAIQAWGVDFAENLNANQNKSVSIKGGYDSGYLVNAGYTNLHGSLTIGAGAVTVENLVVK